MKKMTKVLFAVFTVFFLFTLSCYAADLTTPGTLGYSAAPTIDTTPTAAPTGVMGKVGARALMKPSAPKNLRVVEDEKVPGVPGAICGSKTGVPQGLSVRIISDAEAAKRKKAALKRRSKMIKEVLAIVEEDINTKNPQWKGIIFKALAEEIQRMRTKGLHYVELLDGSQKMRIHLEPGMSMIYVLEHRLDVHHIHKGFFIVDDRLYDWALVALHWIYTHSNAY